jgi:hypothetical protein
LRNRHRFFVSHDPCGPSRSTRRASFGVGVTGVVTRNDT